VTGRRPSALAAGVVILKFLMGRSRRDLFGTIHHNSGRGDQALSEKGLGRSAIQVNIYNDFLRPFVFNTNSILRVTF
jgi:hypothetical protein